jgi:HPt (histidine-containing phosphotransfer) domain-containing protein
MPDRAKPYGQPGTRLPPPLIRIFFEVNDELLVRLGTAMKAHDVAAALQAAHAIKGAGLFAGFGSVAEPALELELSLRARRWDQAEAVILFLERQLRSQKTKPFG